MLKREVEEVIKREGKARGAVLQTDAIFIKNMYGGCLKCAREQAANAGAPTQIRQCKSVRAMEWLP